MPRKTKENEELKSPEKKKTTTKSKEITNKKALTSTKKQSAKKTSTPQKKVSNSKKTKTTNKTTTKKSSVTKNKPKTQNTLKPSIVEYYDLPYRYNQTIVKILAQTPKTLFVYWDISDEDREKYKIQYGENFFETTKPVLIIYNDTLHYSFEVDINDFANSWYLHINDSKSDYRIELGRRPIINNEKIQNNYVYITSSNKIESPNDHILFNKDQKMIYFRNVKTNQETSKSISNLSFIRNMGKIYNIYDLYKEIYKNENVEEIYDLKNPSSHTSSQFK